MGIPLVRGRDFTEQDREPAPPVVVVNATLANRHWPGEDPLGKRVQFGEEGATWMTVVGVAGDSKNVGLDIEPAPLIYIPYRYFPLPLMNVVVRSAAEPGVVATVIREQVRQADPDLPVDRVVPLREIVRESMAQPGSARCCSAPSRSWRGVMLPVVREGLGVLGIVLGLAGAGAATRFLASLLYGVQATDPATFAGVAVVLLGVACLASYIPSRRVLRVDPLVALKSE